MKRKCSHMWKWPILCPFHLPPLELQPDQTGHGSDHTSAGVTLLFQPTVVMKGNRVI